MKKILLMAVMAVVCMTVNAQKEQWLVDCYYEATEVYGEDWVQPVSIWFKSDGTCEYTNTKGHINCSGYVITDGGYGYKLHLFSGKDFDGNPEFTMVNLSIGYYKDAGDLFFAPFDTYDQLIQYAVMHKKDAPSGVRTANVEKTATDSTKYNLNGMPVENPQGIYIQSGKKKVAK